MIKKRRINDLQLMPSPCIASSFALAHSVARSMREPTMHIKSKLQIMSPMCIHDRSIPPNDDAFPANITLTRKAVAPQTA
mmetsp:Transcript_9752/g.20227  ORF Transcript_9752/g.20227 Transcript_9752/m.20227 type:complete len:80 (-) Transcript_9752:371-610(-)